MRENEDAGTHTYHILNHITNSRDKDLRTGIKTSSTYTYIYKAKNYNISINFSFMPDVLLHQYHLNITPYYTILNQNTFDINTIT